MMIDVHAHLQDKAFDKDRYEIIKKCQEDNIYIVNCGLGKDNDMVSRIKSKNVFYCRGLYPVDAIEMKENEIRKIIDSFSDPNSVCIGEVGLDYHWIKKEEDRKKEREIFKEVVWKANKLKKTLNVHSRDAEYDVIKELEDANVNVILHSFGKIPWKEIIEDERFFFSIPVIALRSHRWKKVIEILPENKILLESDSPYQGIDKRNTPLSIMLTQKLINEIKGKDLTRVVFENSIKTLGLSNIL